MKGIWIALLFMAGALAVPAQDDRYYENNNGGGDDVYTDNTQTEEQMDQSATSYQTFYNDLDPYGRWIQSPAYGYVWSPAQAGAGFEPYLTNGHWEYTEYGWTWVSDFSWGWATFHYGRWYMDPAYGWVWVPGSLWAPAWVDWGQYEGYYCWAPLWPGEYTSTHYGSRDHHWYFAQQNHIVDHDLSDHVVSQTVVRPEGGSLEQHIIRIDHVGSLDGSKFFAGPKLKEVEKEAGHTIPRATLSSAPRPEATHVSDGHISIYRPAIRPVAKPQEAPTRTTSPDNTEPTRVNTPQRPPQPSGGLSEPVRQPRGQTEISRPSAAPQIQRTEPSYQRVEPAQRPVRNPSLNPAGGGAAPSQPQIRMTPAPVLSPARVGGPRR
ncbi:MAG: hypothetical protein JSS76_09550 [Bacteroidetes bacterium]|nr:hypothetical protein [Bacteroidota bacterium]